MWGSLTLAPNIVRRGVVNYYSDRADAKKKSAKIETIGILSFSRKFAPAKISRYTVYIYPSRFGMQLEDEPTVVKTWVEFAVLHPYIPSRGGWNASRDQRFYMGNVHKKDKYESRGC